MTTMQAETTHIFNPGPRSRRIFAQSQQLMPGGVNSPVRAFGRLGGQPPVIKRGHGAWLTDEDGQSYVDYVLSWGPLLHGHAHPKILQAVNQAAADGTSFGAPTKAENDLAKLLIDAVPSLEKVRLVNSGTEATMSALRLARAATGRSLVVKCDGCYHGHADHLLVAAGSGAATCGEPDSPGVPAAFANQTVVVPYNDPVAMEQVLSEHGKDIAAVILEPVCGNMGMVLPKRGYLQRVRKACTQAGALLIFDEVMTGFRVAWGGYQTLTKVQPDLTCLGKTIGGGLPMGAYGGSAALMDHLAPIGACYQAGTLSGNPVAVAAGIANLNMAKRQGFYDRLQEKAEILTAAMKEAADQHGVPLVTSALGSMWGWFFAKKPVRDFAAAAACDMDRWQRFTTACFEHGVNVAPSPFEAAFISAAHDNKALRHSVKVFQQAMAAAA